ncbi:MAG: polyprenyl diphosphate synthase [Patescibacteria group bacterium]|nr:polyprenyl diphosphate synthase [Patescibacteria group bacterium]MCL5094189.1 polyprenyl diphosphate synthase [Patescibacteria group bacterium]
MAKTKTDTLVLEKLAYKNRALPRHIAIIMDGNRRWAKKRGLGINSGHREGAKTLEKIIRYLGEKKLPILTIYAFSTENWKRDEKQIKGLLSIMIKFLKEKEKELIANNIVLKVIGDLDRFPNQIKNRIKNLVERTKTNKGSVLNVALNYGGRDEIIRAINKIVDKGKKIISETEFDNFLDTKDIPDPDIMIRTGGEKRLSNFLLWQLSYAELFFTNTLWPDFSIEELEDIISEFQYRRRNFGS